MENKDDMATQVSLVELEQRHHAIEKEIAEIMKYGYGEDLKVVELKRQKLHLKDEIERLRHENEL